MGPLKSPFLPPSTTRPTSPPSRSTPPLGHHRLPPPPPPPPPLSLPPPPPPPGSSSLPLPSSSPPLPPPYDALGLPPPPPPPPPLPPPPPPLPRDRSHLSRISSSPPLSPSSRALPKTTPPHGHLPGPRAAWEAGLPTIVLALPCSSPARLTRGRHSVEQLAPARGPPVTKPICADASGEDLAGVPPELLPPKKRLVRYRPYDAASTIQEIASHGGDDGFGNRPVPLTVEGGGVDGFGNRPVPLTVEGDGDGFRNGLVPPTVEGDGDSGVRGDERQVDRDDDGLGAALRRLRVSRPVLVLTKRLTLSDRSRENARLILPDGLVRASPLLRTMTAWERNRVLEGGGLAVQAFDRRGRPYRMMLRRDCLARTYRLTGEWTLFLSQHGGMSDGDDVEVLAFRPPDWQERGECGLGLALLHYRSAGAATRTANGMDWGGQETYEADVPQLLDANPARPERLPRRRRRRSGYRNAPARRA